MNFNPKSVISYTAPAIECLEIEVEQGFAGSDVQATIPGFTLDQNANNGDWFQSGDEEY